MFVLKFALSLFAAILSVGYGQLTVAPVASNVSVAFLQQAELTCAVLYEGTTPPTVAILKAEGSHSSSFTTSEADGLTTLTLLAAQVGDQGEFVCRATLDGTTLDSSFFLEVRNEFAFILQPEDDSDVPLGGTARFLCSPNMGSVAFWRKDGEMLQFDGRIASFNSSLGVTINNVTYRDMGNYECVAMFNNEVMSAAADLTVQGYAPPVSTGSSTGVHGFVTTADQLTIACPVVGPAGPLVFVWQKESSSGVPGEVVSQNATSAGPFVNPQMELDLSEALPEDGGFYRCYGVDVTGANATQLFLVEVVADDSVELWREWYFILIYCVVGVVLVAILVLALWYFISTRKLYCQKVKKVERVKRRVKKSDLKNYYA